MARKIPSLAKMYIVQYQRGNRQGLLCINYSIYVIFLKNKILSETLPQFNNQMPCDNMYV